MEKLVLMLALATFLLVVWQTVRNHATNTIQAQKVKLAISHCFTAYDVSPMDALRIEYEKRMRRLDIRFSNMDEENDLVIYGLYLTLDTQRYLKLQYQRDPEYKKKGSYYQLKKVGEVDLKIYFLDDVNTAIIMSKNEERDNILPEIVRTLPEADSAAKPDTEGLRNPPEVVKQVETRSGVRTV